jgi:choline dehydrogenase-like flavoprotein
VEYRARKQVILSAGTIETTLLLERSGIGSPDVLRRAGVDMSVESPNVGERIIEQRGVRMQFRLNREIGLTPRVNTFPKQMWEGTKYIFTRHGPIATGPYDLVCQFKSSPELDRPDIQGMFTPIALDTTNSLELKVAKHSGVMFEGYQMRPSTTSSIHIGGRKPQDTPIVDAHFFEAEEDRRAVASVLATVRDVFTKSPVADYVLYEELPGPDVVGPDDAVRYATDRGAAIYHAVGASAMGPDAADVVDPELRVRGVSGLRIVDASVLPVQMAGNSQAPVMAVAWIAADLILEEQGTTS